MAEEEKPAFDPSQPFTVAPALVGSGEKPPFDPSQPFTPGRQPTGYWGHFLESEKGALETVNRTLNPFSQAHVDMRARQAKEGLTLGETLGGETWSGLGALAQAAGQAVIAPLAAPVNYLESQAIKHIGEPIARGISYLRGKEPAPMPSREQIAEDIAPKVETAVSLMRPAAGVPAAGLPARVSSVPPPPVPPPQPTPRGPFGVELSEGQATGDLATIQREQAALRGTSGAPAQRVAQGFADQQQAQLAAARGDIAQSLDVLGNQVIAAGPQEAGDLVSAGVGRAARREKGLVDLAYEAARAHPGEIHAGVFEGMGSGIKGDLSLRTEPIIVDDRLTPYAARMIDDLEGRISQLRIQNRADPFGQPSTENIVGVNLAGVDQMRKRLSSMRRDAYASGNAADGRAAQAVIDAFDARIDQAVNGGLFNGDARAIQAWNDARAAYADYRQTFTAGKNDPVGRVVERILGRGNTPAAHGNDVADFIYGRSGTNPSTRDVAVAQRIRSILGEQSPEWTAARQGLFSRLTETPSGVTDWGPGKIANRLNQFLNGDGRELARVMFSQQERGMLQNYADLMRQLEIPQAGANWSNTATFLQRIGSRIGSNVAGALGSIAGHFVGVPYVGELAGYGLGNAAARLTARAAEQREARAVSALMPTVAYQVRQWQQAVRRAASNATPAARAAASAAGVNLARSLKQMGITAVEAAAPAGAQDQQNQVPRPPPEQHNGGGVNSEQPRAQGGHVGVLRRQGGRVKQEKLPHSSVAYVARSVHKDKRCSLCSMFVEEGPHCTLVWDPIAAGGYCRRFARKKD